MTYKIYQYKCKLCKKEDKNNRYGSVDSWLKHFRAEHIHEYLTKEYIGEPKYMKVLSKIKKL